MSRGLIVRRLAVSAAAVLSMTGVATAATMVVIHGTSDEFLAEPIYLALH